MSKLVYVPGEGSIYYAKYIVIGEAPGAVEERLRRPFMGKAGTYLRSVLADLGIDQKTYFTNVLKIRPEDNRPPSSEEVESWKHSLYDELMRVNPDAKIILLGKSAEKAMEEFFLTRDTLMLPHPSYVVRFGKKKDFEDKLRRFV